MKQSLVSRIQAIYYLLTGAWPVIDINTFMMVTGPKTDIWLVKMVGLLTVAIAISIFYAIKRDARTAKVLGISAACSYTAIDIYYAVNDVIRDIYLADAALELLIIILLLSSRPTNERETS